MPDYRELYFSMFRAMEKAVSILIEAQRKAEETVISEELHGPMLLPVEENAEEVGHENNGGGRRDT